MKKIGRNLVILLLWLFLWQLLDWYIHMDMLIAGPIDTLQALKHLIGQNEFWTTIWYSMERIVEGFFLAFLCGVILGGISFRVHFIKEFLLPAVNFMRSVPIASFIVLALLWVGSKGLATLIAFLIAFPIIYESVIAGLSQADKKLLEMCRVFSIGHMHKACTVYWYSLYPVLCTACKNAMGMAWKAGVAAEVLGVPANSLGEKLYYAKIYLETGELLAWTLVIMICSSLTAWSVIGILFVVNKLMCYVCGTGKGKMIQETPTLEGRNLEKVYGENKVLKNISFSIPYGTVIAIMGKSGIGKTTLLRLIAGLEEPNSGVIEKNGAKISMAFQENRLCEPLTAWQNCRMSISGREKSLEAVRAYNKGYEAKGKIGRNTTEICAILEEILPSECQKQAVAQFSGGMKRRVAIARAMLAYSNIVILDEPFSGLDEENRKKTIEFIKKYQMGRTIIFTTHREDDVIEMKAEKIIL